MCFSPILAGHPLSRGLRFAAIAFLMLLLSSCGGGGTTSDKGAADTTTIKADGTVIVGLRPLPDGFSEWKAVAYSPFRTSTSEPARASEVITDAMVKQDLELLRDAGFGLIRVFASNKKEGITALRVIKANSLPIKVMLGAYINSFEYDPSLSASAKATIMQGNEEELARAVALANAYPDEVVAVSVGNETQVDWSFVKISSNQLAKYIAQVRKQIKQPVTTDDNYAPFAGKLPHHPAANQVTEVLAQIDFLSIHSYPSEDALYSNFDDTDPWPDWDWRQTTVAKADRATAMMDAALAMTQKQFSMARAFLNAKGKSQMPIMIGETGWKAAMPGSNGNNARYKFMANQANQKMYYLRLSDWASATKNGTGPKNIVWFEAFDEIWKGSDDKWGLFTKERTPRAAALAAPVVVTDAVYWKEATANPAVPSSRYTIYGEKATTDETLASASTTDLRWDPFGDSAYNSSFADNATSDTGGSKSLSITPNPRDYGWGVLYQSPSETTSNLSDFTDSTASLNFSIKTSYVGALEIGFSTDTELREAQEVFLKITDGDAYGYQSRGEWRDVSIPLSAFKAINGKLDMRYLLSRFMIADRYQYTGNTAGQNVEVRIDRIYWSK
jgi:exo-beta-1,3-glucanase (GH17 family)